jgi:hypothetical protein
MGFEEFATRRKAMRLKRIWIIYGLLGIAALALLIGFFVSRRPPANPTATLKPQAVFISSPESGSQFPLGSLIVIDVTTSESEQVQAIELWVDGQLLGLQERPDLQTRLLQTSFVWQPSNPGVHALSARTIGANGPLSYSNMTKIEVYAPAESPPGMDTVDYDRPAVVPAAEESPPAAPSTPPSQVPEANPWSGKTSGEAQSPGVSKPFAPELALQAEGCGAKLLIHDLAQDEDGFRVYRQASNSDSWKLVAQLSSNTAGGWTSYHDSAYPGGFMYFVASFNSAGETPGNQALVNIDPSACPSPVQAAPAFEFDFQELLGASGAERAYCYRSFDGMHWERFPSSGSIPLDRAEIGQGETSPISLAGLKPGAAQRMGLQLDCWGWFGGRLKHLGEFAGQFDLSDLETLPGQIKNSPFGAGLKYLPQAEAPALSPLGGTFDIQLQGGLLHYLLPVYEPSMPYLYAFYNHDPDTCLQHLPPDFQNLVGQLLFCSPYPGFESDPEAVNPQPYLVWDDQNSCPSSGSTACVTYQNWLAKVEQEDGDVWFIVVDESSAGRFTWPIHGAEMQNWTIKPLDCTGQRSLHISMYYADGDEFLFGPESNKVTLDCPHPLPWVIPLAVSFDSIRFYNLDDGDNGAVVQDVEVFGYLLAASSQGNRYVNFAKWDQQADNCPDEAFSGSLSTGGTLFSGCTITFDDTGPYDLSEAQLCQSTSKYNCSLAGWGYDNNVVQLGVDDGDGIMLQLLIIDWDDASANDLQCMGWLYLPARGRLEWAQVQNQSFTIDSINWGSGSCKVEGTINAVLP